MVALVRARRSAIVSASQRDSVCEQAERLYRAVLSYTLYPLPFHPLLNCQEEFFRRQTFRSDHTGNDLNCLITALMTKLLYMAGLDKVQHAVTLSRQSCDQLRQTCHTPRVICATRMRNRS